MAPSGLHCWLLLCHEGSFVRRVDSLGVVRGLSECGAWTPEREGFSICYSQALLLRGMWELISPTRDLSCVPCTVRWVLKHWAAGEAPLAKLGWHTRCQKSYILAYLGGLYVSDVATLDKPVNVPVPQFPSLVTLSLVPLRCPWMEWEQVCKSAKCRRKPAEGNVRKTGFSHVFSRHKAWGVLKIQVMQTVQCPVPISGRNL